MAHAPPKLESLLELQFSRVRTGSLDVHAHPSSCIMSRSLLCCYCHYRHNGRPHISVKGCVHFTVGRSSFLRPNSSGKALNKHSQPTTNSLAGPEGRPVLHSPLNTDAQPHPPFAFYQQLQKGGRGQFLGTKAGLGCQWPSQKPDFQSVNGCLYSVPLLY